MSKELEALEVMLNPHNEKVYFDDEGEIKDGEYFYTREQIIIIKKGLQALEIINNRKVNVKELKKCDSVGKYNYRIYKEEEKLTQEEYDLLKEVLL